MFPLADFEFYHQDVSDYVHVAGELDYILHFASPASPIDYLKIPIQTLKVGSLGTHNLLGLAMAKMPDYSSLLPAKFTVTLWYILKTKVIMAM